MPRAPHRQRARRWRRQQTCFVHCLAQPGCPNYPWLPAMPQATRAARTPGVDPGSPSSRGRRRKNTTMQHQHAANISQYMATAAQVQRRPTTNSVQHTTQVQHQTCALPTLSLYARRRELRRTQPHRPPHMRARESCTRAHKDGRDSHTQTRPRARPAAGAMHERATAGSPHHLSLE